MSYAQVAGWLHNRFAETLGWALFHSLWQVCVVGAVCGMALFLCRRRAAGVRYVMACGGMVCMLGWPVGTYMYLLPAAPMVVRAAVLPEPAGVPAMAGPVVMAEPVGVVVKAVEMPARVEVVSVGERVDRAVRPWLPVAIVVYGCGMVLMMMRLGAGYVRLHRLTRMAGPAPEGICRMVAGLQERLGMTRAVRVLESARVEVPTLMGMVRPIIFLPASALTGLSAEQLMALLAHELAHVRRHDYLVNLAQSVVETLLFYHPVAWWLSARIRQEREHCCDDVAVAVTENRLVYARALESMERLRAAPERVPARLALGARSGELLPRIRRILGIAPATVPRTTLLTASGALTLLILLAGTLIYLGCSQMTTAAREGGAALAKKETIHYQTHFVLVPDEFFDQNPMRWNLGNAESHVTIPEGGTPLTSAESPRQDYPWAIVDGRRVEQLLAAVKANKDADDWGAPALKAFEGEKAEMFSGQVQEYVKSVEKAGPTATNPSVPVGVKRNMATLMTGISLSMTGSLADAGRTIETAFHFKATWLEGMDSFSVTGDDANFIQLPKTSTAEAAATARIPDGETFLLRGPHVFLEKPVETSVPVLSKIPGLNKLLTSRSYVKKKQTVLIFITAATKEPAPSANAKEPRENAAALLAPDTISVEARVLVLPTKFFDDFRIGWNRIGWNLDIPRKIFALTPGPEDAAPVKATILDNWTLNLLLNAEQTFNQAGHINGGMTKAKIGEVFTVTIPHYVDAIGSPKSEMKDADVNQKFSVAMMAKPSADRRYVIMSLCTAENGVVAKESLTTMLSIPDAGTLLMDMGPSDAHGVLGGEGASHRVMLLVRPNLVITRPAPGPHETDVSTPSPRAAGSPDDMTPAERKEYVAATIKNGTELYEATKFKEAADAFRHATQLDPGNESAKLLLRLVEDKISASEHQRQLESGKAPVSAIPVSSAAGNKTAVLVATAKGLYEAGKYPQAGYLLLHALDFDGHNEQAKALLDQVYAKLFGTEITPIPSQELRQYPSGPWNFAAHDRLQENALALDFEKVPLQKVLESLFDAGHIRYVVEWDALDAAGVEKETVVTLHVKNTSYEKALQAILTGVSPTGHSVGFSLMEGTITISTGDVMAAGTDLTIRVYDIRDILATFAPRRVLPDEAAQDADHSGAKKDVPAIAPGEKASAEKRDMAFTKDIVDTIVGTVAPDSWSGTGGKVGRINVLNGQLIVSQTAATQKQVEAVIEQLRDVRARRGGTDDLKVDPGKWIEITGQPNGIVAVADTAPNRAARDRLAGKLAVFDADEENLEKVLSHFRDQIGFNVFVDWSALKAAGVERTTAISVHMKDVPFGQVLAAVLTKVGGNHVDLSYTIDEGIITVTSKGGVEATQYWLVRVFDVHDIVAGVAAFPQDVPRGAPQALSPATPLSQEEIRATQLLDFIRATVAPESWKGRVNGGGNVRVLNGQLIVSQTAAKQLEIARALAALRGKMGIPLPALIESKPSEKETSPSPGSMPATRGENPILKKDSKAVPDSRAEAAAAPADAQEKPMVPADRAVRDHLEENAEVVNFDKTGLEKAINSLGDKMGVRVTANWAALKAVGIDKETPISIELKNVPYRKALKTILAQASADRPGEQMLNYVIDGGVIGISTKADLENQQAQIDRVFDVRDMLVTYTTRTAPPLGVPEDVGGAAKVEAARMEEEKAAHEKQRVEIVKALKNTIVNTVAPNSWRENGGKVGSIDEVNGQFVVHQTIDNQKVIAALLLQIRVAHTMQIAVETRAILVDEATFKALALPKAAAPGKGLPQATGGTLIPLTEAELKKLLETVAASRASTSISPPRVTMFNGQSGYLTADRQQVEYVAGFEQTRNAAGTMVSAPVKKNLTYGFVMDFSTGITADRKSVFMTLDPQYVMLDGFDPVPAGKDAKGATAEAEKPKVTVAKAHGVAVVGDGQTMVLVVDQPVLEDRDVVSGVRGLAEIPGVGAVFTQRSRVKSPRRLLVVVRPNIIIHEEEEVVP